MKFISSIKKIVKRDHTFIASNSIQWFGSGYGGFYLDKSLISPASILFSFGVGEDISFDLAVSKLGLQNIFLFDPTPKAIDYVKKMHLPDNFYFSPIGISDKDEYADFFLPRNDDNVSGSLAVHKQLDSAKVINVQLKKLSTIINELNVQKIDILKMDIEGSEYKVLNNIMMEGIFPTQICIEFHNNFYKNGKKLFKETVDLMSAKGYEIKAISDSGNELLFVRN